MAVAWERWDEVSAMANPTGYVFGVGRNTARRASRRRRPVYVDLPEQGLPDVEPGLPAALAGLPEKQRVAVALVHGYGWSMAEVAELLGTKKTTVQNHVERGLAKLRRTLGVTP
jgi:DNA-directed RNA polymerase specialized sigma24 family protein